MFRTQALLLALLLMSSATAFAADTPDPASKAKPNLSSEAGAPNPSSKPVNPSEVEALPSATPPPAAKLPPAAGESGLNPDAPPPTSPGEENKGKPPVPPQ
jgi:hypothetical protein